MVFLLWCSGIRGCAGAVVTARLYGKILKQNGALAPDGGVNERAAGHVVLCVPKETIQ